MASEALLELKALMDQDIPPYPPINNVIDVLQRFTTGVAEGGPTVRQAVIDQKAYAEICKSWYMYCDTGECNVRDFSPEAEAMREETLKALYAITAGFPEIVDAIAFIMLKQAMDSRLPESTHILALKLMRNICATSEQNREILTTYCRIIQPLSRLIKKNNPSSEFVREWCSAAKALILNDDRRVAYNRAPERKRMLHQNNVIRYLAEYLNVYREGPTLNALVIILASMACCEDYCIAMYTGNILPAISKILGKMHSNSLLAKNTLSLLRFMNISSIVREKVCGQNIMETVVKCGWLYRNREDMLEIALSCIAFMTLRCPCHVAQFLNEDGVNKLVEIIGKHMENRAVLKGVCFIIRNIAVHGGKEGAKQIIAADGENLLKQIQEKHPDLKANYTKPALRDLKLPVSPTKLPSTISGELLEATIGSDGSVFPDPPRKSVELSNLKLVYPPASQMFDYPPESSMYLPSAVACPEEQKNSLERVMGMSIDVSRANDKNSISSSSTPKKLSLSKPLAKLEEAIAEVSKAISNEPQSLPESLNEPKVSVIKPPDEKFSEPKYSVVSEPRTSYPKTSEPKQSPKTSPRNSATSDNNKKSINNADPLTNDTKKSLTKEPNKVITNTTTGEAKTSVSNPPPVKTSITKEATDGRKQTNNSISKSSEKK